MNYTTQAIVIGLSKYKDNLSILSVYSLKNGRQQVLVYGHKWRSVLGPLNIVELTLQEQPGRDMATLQSVSLIYVAQRITMDVSRQCVAMFMAELIDKTFVHPMADMEVFAMLVGNIQKLDTTEEVDVLPYHFMQELSLYLGYGGEELEEWRGLKSLEVIRTVFG